MKRSDLIMDDFIGEGNPSSREKLLKCSRIILRNRNRFYCKVCKSNITDNGCTFCDKTEGRNPPKEVTTMNKEKDTTTDNQAAYKVSHKFYIAGVQYHQLHKVLDGLEVDQHMQLVPEPTNKYDPNAVRIEFKDTMCGYCPKKFSSEVCASIAIGCSLKCIVVELNKLAKPWEMCKVEIREVT